MTPENFAKLCLCRANLPVINNIFRQEDHHKQEERVEIGNIPNRMAIEMYEQNHADMDVNERNSDEEWNANE